MTPGDRDPGTAPDPGAYASVLDEMAGDGSETNPFVVTDVVELQAIAGDLGGHYVLGNDVDASPTRDWDGQFDPILDPGTEPSEFHGEFDGRGHEIGGLAVADEAVAALFGRLDGGGVIRDVTLVNVTVRGDNIAAPLVGLVADGLVADVAVTGSSGLVGAVTDVLANASGESDPDVVGDGMAGGLVGSTLGGTVRDATADVTVTVAADGPAGGLLAANRNGGTVVDSTAACTVRATGSAGGLLANNGSDCRVEASTASGDVTGDRSVGGLVGKNNETGTITGCSAEGRVEGRVNVGGLVGHNRGAVSDSTADCTVSGDRAVGDIVGKDTGMALD